MNDILFTPIRLNELAVLIQNSVEKAMKAERENPPQAEIDPNEKLTVEQAAQFLGITTPTLYSKNSLGELPSCKAPGTKRLFFFKKDLLDYMKQGRKLTNHEIQVEAVKGLTKKRKG